MELLKEYIRKEGVGIGKNVVKVDSFLNHRVNVDLASRMGQEIRDAFKDEKVDCIMTVEAGGIVTAVTTAQAFGNIPVIFAKKGEHVNVGDDVLTAQVYSFTSKVVNTIRVSRSYLPEGTRVLIVDDFLAEGEAIEGLISIIRQARAVLVGAAVCVEKGFQKGGKRLREQGVRVVSLATVDAVQDGKIILRDD